METKVIHLHFKDDGASIIHDWYFGSLKAIYDFRTVEEIGISYKSLTNALRGKEVYENKKVNIRIGKLERKPKQNN